VTSAGFSFADRAYVIPFGADPGFDDALRVLLQRERPDFIVPLVDEEIPKVHRLVAAEWPALRVIAPTLAFSELVLDKWTMANALTKQIRDFAFKRQDIFQKSFNTFVHRFPHFAACWERWGLCC